MNIRECTCNNCMIERGRIHLELEKLFTYCDSCKTTIGDGHDCDNCAFCGTDN